MKYCPNCINEFRDDVDISECPDCGVPLVEGANPRFSDEPRPEDEEDLVELTQVTEQWQADFLRSALETEGIPTGQSPTEQSTLLHLPPVEVTDVITILVNAADREKALQVLKDLDSEETTDVIFCSQCFKAVDRSVEKCPHCGYDLTAPGD